VQTKGRAERNILSRILWLRSSDPAEEVRDLEQKTGLAVAVSDSFRSGSLERIQLVLIEFPISATVIQETLEAAHRASFPIPVILYDRDSTLDESLIRPPMTTFRHLVGHQEIDELAAVVREAMEQAAQNVSGAREPWRDLLVGESRAMQDLHALIRLVSPRQSTVLITGETGTGKEMVARAIHMASKRAASRMVAVNCSAIPENLVESELFGHAKGAFTGAVNDRIGRFEQAHRATIFLDEIGEIPLPVQPKLLRVLQERELQRVGGSGTIQIDTRVIAASNIDLNVAVAQKRFREDLLYRLNVVPIAVPPLRDRLSDIPVLAEHFIQKICGREGLRPKTLSADTLRRLSDYEWPGNVRQLEHAIETAVTLAGDRERLYAGDIQLPDATQTLQAIGPAIPIRASGVNFEEVMGQVEKLLLQEALRRFDGNKAKAASFLGIPRTTLLYKVKATEMCAS
jgi:transcriptional regulator with GAF, ATPase, and Fis domain